MRSQANRLIREKSPYLLQHAYNPVDWYPWGKIYPSQRVGPEAFQRAKQENKPIFLSIGYSTCHWCHVMERESFENESIAALMNEYFINIKVDREERPNIDRMYMTFVQATTGRGGWPMSVFLTNELKPFFGGTYFAPTDRYGMPGFPRLLTQIGNLWKQNPDKINHTGNAIGLQLKQAMMSSAGTSQETPRQVSKRVFDHLRKTFDSTLGGFGGSPKFPTPPALFFLLNYYLQHNIPLKNLNDGTLDHLAQKYGFHGQDPNEVRKELTILNEEANEALEMVDMTLLAIAKGGIHDHVGKGFHRYSVDQYWHVPHFEKMLYDQGQLLSLYSAMYLLTHKQEHVHVVKDIIEYVEKNLQHSTGGFYSAEDADSYEKQGDTEKKEGAFAVWTMKELQDHLREKAHIFSFVYGAKDQGNVTAEQDPHGELTHKNVLIQRHSVEYAAQHFGKSKNEIEMVIHQSLEILAQVRSLRPKPHLDDKIVTSWNGESEMNIHNLGLMISGLATAARASRHEFEFSEKAVQMAIKAAQFINQELYDTETHTLKRSFREGPANIDGFAEDYAFLIQGLLDLYQATMDEQWLRWAGVLQEKMNQLFWDNNEGGYFSGPEEDNQVFVRMKDDHDGAEPCANSVALWNLLRLNAIVDSKYEHLISRHINAFSQVMERGPQSMATFVAGTLAFQSGLTELTVKTDSKELMDIIQTKWSPFFTLVCINPKENVQLKYLSQASPMVKQLVHEKKEFKAFLCKDFQCLELNQPAELIEKMNDL